MEASLNKKYKVEMNLTCYQLGILTGILVKIKDESNEKIIDDMMEQIKPTIVEVYKDSGFKNL